VIGIVVSRKIEGAAVARADILQLFLKADGNALGVEGIRLRQNDAEEVVRKVVDGVRRAQSLGYGLGGVTQCGFLIIQRSARAGLGLGEDQGESLLHGHGAAELHGQAIPKVIVIGHGLKQIGARLNLESEVAFKLGEEMLFELVESALAIKEIAEEEQGESAETEEGHAQGPLVAYRMDENERVHKEGQACGQNQHEDSGEDRELEPPPFEAIKFQAIDSCHLGTCLSNLSRAQVPTRLQQYG